ncbi:Na(+)/citrate cotransporter-like [Halichondria panicea]|uniref:Na(+)/citrate cotransporter-like n=1 Tax=Halichondria panicea TaxID=6063 RepID=UPI00312B477D
MATLLVKRARGDDTTSLVEESSDGKEEEASVYGGGKGKARRLMLCCWRHSVTRLLRSWWRTLVIVLTPLIFLPLALPLDWNVNAARAGYTIILIAVFWLTEVVPIAVTALLPLILFPALGVLPSDAVARNYLRDTNLLFLGGLMMAVAVEKWNLHRRIALSVMRLVGASPRWLLLGFMGTTAFLSMWISNTATSAMMLPIANAVLEEIKNENKLPKSKEGRVRYTRRGEEVSIEQTPPPTAQGRPPTPPPTAEGSQTTMVTVDIEDSSSENGERISEESDSGTGGQDTDNFSSPPESNTETSQLLNVADTFTSDPLEAAKDKRFNRMAKAMMLGVAYAANIGGTATLTGTGPNIVLNGLAGDLGVNFGLWFAFAAPPMILALVCAWLYLSLVFCDDSFVWCKRKLFGLNVPKLDSSRAKEVIKEQYNKLGRIKYAEVIVLVMFILLVVLWFTRDPRFIPGWSSLFKSQDGGASYFTDATTVLVIVFLLFLIPSQPCCPSNWIGAGNSPRLLDWKSVQTGLPWNVVIVLGSGFALAAGAEASGLSGLLGDYLTVLRCLPTPLIAFLVSVIVAMVTEVLSNVATATLFLPVLRGLAEELCIHPLYLMLPATVSASFAFMLPVATPPNTIAFTYGYIKVYDMVLTGFFMNLLCIGIVALSVNTLGLAVFSLNTLPASVLNSTACFANNASLDCF